MSIDSLVSAIIIIIVFYVLFFIGKKVNDWLHREYRLLHELVEKDNPALALAVVGYYLGLVFALGGALVGPSRGILEDVIDLVVYGCLAIVLLNISWWLCDKLILYRFKLSDELVRDQNQGSGAVSCGTSLASGLIIFGAVSGEGGNIWSAIIFWGVGQLLLVLAGWVYNWITPYDIHSEIEKDNVAAGVSFGGALTAMGIIVGKAAEGDVDALGEGLLEFVSFGIVGLLLLPMVRLLTDKILLPTVKLTDEIARQEHPNVGAAYIETCAYIAAALIIYWCV